MADGRFYSRFYKEHETPSRAFRVLSLCYNKCVAKLDYTGFLRRHPSNHRFSATRGRTLASLVVVHISKGHGMFRSEASGEMPVPARSPSRRASSRSFPFLGGSRSCRASRRANTVREKTPNNRGARTNEHTQAVGL